MTDPINANSVNEADYLNLFMQELTYQDPLKPVDNKEFMAQMAQFSSLQEARTTNEQLTNLLFMNADVRALNVLGKTVTLKNADGQGRVTKVEFVENALPQVTVMMDKNQAPTQVDFGQIMEVIS